MVAMSMIVQCGIGATVWDAALVLAGYLEEHPDLCQKAHVLEVGAGTHFKGIWAMMMEMEMALL